MDANILRLSHLPNIKCQIILSRAEPHLTEPCIMEGNILRFIKQFFLPDQQ
jgi:hypothetical protein